MDVHEIELEKTEKSMITGPLVDDPLNASVSFHWLESPRRRLGTILLAFLALLLTAVYVTVLVYSAYRAIVEGTQQFATLVAVLALGNEIVKSPLIITLSYAAVFAKKPVPVYQAQDLNVLLGITFVPSSEDLEGLQNTLIAAKAIKYEKGTFAIAVFDEGSEADMTSVSEMIGKLNDSHPGHHVYWISRRPYRKYTQEKGKYAVKNKYGNINACIDIIKNDPAFYGTFDILMGLDPDHVGMDVFAERMLGPFNDPNVAFVAGPQSYENAPSNLVARWGESNQFVFHSLVQGVGNLVQAAMLVGTSYAIRMKVLDQIDGIQPSKTEDLATTFAILSSKNPETGKLWNSVYTPDLLAHGEGPNTWGDFFKQQDRWSSGAIELLVRGPLIKQLFKMWRRPMRVFHYTMLMAFYPIMATSWLLAAANTALIAVVGANGRILDPEIWVILYGWATLAQAALYFRMRRHNVSPFEQTNSWGFYGMFMGVVTAPIYANAFVKTIFAAILRRQPESFATTPKGDKAVDDTWHAFRLNTRWMVFYAALIIVGYFNNHLNLFTVLWALLAILLLAAPILIWRITRFQERRKAAAVEKAAADEEFDEAEEAGFIEPSFPLPDTLTEKE